MTGEMPNVDILSRKSWRDIIEPVDSLDILDEMFREIQATGENATEYINRIESLVAAWKQEFAVKLESVA